MADGSQLEADLLAALAALPEPDKPTPTQGDVASSPQQSQSQSQPQPRDHAVDSLPPPPPPPPPAVVGAGVGAAPASSHPPIAATTPTTTQATALTVASPSPFPPSPSPAPRASSQPPTQASAPSPSPAPTPPPAPATSQCQRQVSTPGAAHPPTSTTAVPQANSIPTSFALDSHLMADSTPIPDCSPSSQFAQLLAPSQPLIAPPPLQSEPAAPIMNSHAPESNAKRSRSLDSLDDNNVSLKRVKTEPEPAEPKEGGGDKAHKAVPEDLGALLEFELARHSMIKPPIRTDGDIVMHGTDDLRVAATNPVANPANFEFDKTENKIMKASSNSIYIMRSMSLPVLGNVAVQLLVRLSQQSRAETEALLADTNSGFRKAYDALRDVFGPTKKIFSDAPLLSADELDISDSEDRETVRMSNLAAIALSAFGGRDIPLKDVHDNFFTIFVPEEWEYKDSLTELLLSVKTRLFWDSQQAEAGSPTPIELLEALFPINFDEFLKQRTGDLLLNAEEERLVDQVKKRREELVQCVADVTLRTSLQRENSANKVIDHLSAFLQSHLGVVIDYAEKYGVNIPLSEGDVMSFHILGTGDEKQGDQEDSLAALLQSSTSHFPLNGDAKDSTPHDVLPGQAGAGEPELNLTKLIEQAMSEQALSSHVDGFKETPGVQHATNNEQPSFDPTDLASFIAENLKNSIEEPHELPNSSTMPYASALNDSTHGNISAQYEMDYNSPVSAALHPQYINQGSQQQQSSSYQPYTQSPAPATTATGATGEGLPPHQSLPTAALYEKARQAAVAKSSNTARREGLHSTRRPWSPEEEKALMAGLDMVKGPHWSQILSLFGPNGSMSDILKDRTQVQLKDKARNLKLFFLKTNSEMPFYLQSVTGELKTRAPTQAARKEAEERARQNQEEEQARIQSIMTLAGGLHNNHHPVPNASLAASPAPRSSPATPAVGGPNGSMGTAPSQPTPGVHSQPPVPISPLIKTEPLDHYSTPKVTTFPPIQPAPAPSTVAGQPLQPLIKPQLPPLQPQPSPSHQLSQQQQQQSHQNQYQQPRQHQQQQTHQPQQQQQQPQAHQSHHPQPQLQSQSQPQAQTSAQGAPNPPNPQSIQTSAISGYQSQQQQQTHAQAPPAVQTGASNINNTPTFTLPIPPNHHSTPDHAQDSKLFDALQAAIASENQNQSSASGAESAVGTVN